MLNKKILKKCFSPALLALLGLLGGCSGTSESGDGPELQIPDIVEWQENKAFSYPLTTAGTAPFTFQLISTPDAVMFTVDPVSGQLTADHLFDYESPLDSDADGIYELTVNVIDGDSRADTKTFFIEISNVTEFETEVTFPIEHSNAGGVASAMHIRGYLTKDGQRVESQPEEVKVFVAGVEAIFEAEGSSAWVAEVPLELGLNNLAIEVAGDVNIESRASFALDNSPIRAAGAPVAYSDGALFSISVGGKSVLRHAGTSDETVQLFSTEDMPELYGCDLLQDLMSSSTVLVVTCINSEQNIRSVISYDLISRVFSNIASGYSGSAGIAADQYLVVRPNHEIFEVYDLKAGAIAQARIELPSIDYQFGDERFLSSVDGSIYIEIYQDGLEGLAQFHVSQLLQASGTLLAQDLSFSIGSTDPDLGLSTYVASGGSRYYLKDGHLYRQSLNDLSLDHELIVQNIITPGLGISLGGQVIHLDNQFAWVTDAHEQEVVKVEMSSGNSTTLLSPSVSADFSGDLFLNADSTKMVTFDWRNLSYRKVDVLTWSVEESKDFSRFIGVFPQQFAYSNFDWVNSVVYISNILGWGGVPEDSQAHLVALNIQDETLAPLIDGLDLAAHFSDSQITRYRLGTPSYNPVANEVWFSMMAGFEDSGGYEGIYRYDLQQQAISAVSEVAVPLEGNPDTEYVSAYDETSGQVALAGWERGYIKLLQDNGNISTVNAGRNPYSTTIDPEIDSTNNRVFATGFYPQEDNPEFADLSFSEIAAFDMQTGNISVVASNERGHGLPLSWPQKRYDEKNNRLYSIYGGHLMLIDPDYGDRVLVPIQ